MPEQTHYTDDEVEQHLRRYLATREGKSTARRFAIDNDINYRTLNDWLSGKTHPSVYEKFSPEEREIFSLRGGCTDQEGADLLRQLVDGDYKLEEFAKKWELRPRTVQNWISGETRPKIRELLSEEYRQKLQNLYSPSATLERTRSTLNHVLGKPRHAWMMSALPAVAGSSTAGASTVRAPREQAQASRSTPTPAPSEPKERVSTGRQSPASSDLPQQPQGQLPQLAEGVARAARARLPAGHASGASATASNAAAPSSTTGHRGRKRAASHSSDDKRKGFKPKTP